MVSAKSLVAFVCIVLSIGVAGRSPAQDNIIVDRAVIKLAENTGLAIQDQDGFLWFGTNGSGLFRYDGMALKPFKTGPDSISDNYIFALYEDSQGLIWIGTRNGLNRYDKRTHGFTVYRHDPNDANTISDDAFAWGSRSICEDSVGNIWVGTMRGLNRFDKKTNRFTRYLHDPNDPKSLGHDIVYAVIADRDGTIWAATFGGGLNRFNRESGTFTRFVNDPDDAGSLSDNNLMSLIEDRDGWLWIGTLAGGLNRFDKTTGMFKRYVHDPDNPASISHNNVFSIYEDRFGRLWFGRYDVSPSGLETFDKSTQNFRVHHHDPADPKSLSSDLIFGVIEDRSGIMWVIHLMESVDKIDTSKTQFTVFRHNPNNPDTIGANPVVRIYEDRQKDVWIGPFGTGIDKLDRASGRWIHYPPDPDSALGMARYVPGIFEDSEGIFWLGNFDGSLRIFDRERGKIIKKYAHEPDNPKSLVKHSQLNHIREDVAYPHILWLAAYDGGLVKFDKRTDTFVPYNLTSNQMWMFYQDTDGIIWIPTLGGGLDRFDPEKRVVVNYKHSPKDAASISSNSLNYVYEDSTSGILWIGGTAGLDKFDKRTGKVLKRYSRFNGFDIGGVSTIVGDGAGNLWLGTDSGLIRFDTRTGHLKTYDEEDGLPGNKFNFIGAIQDGDGKLWFGTYGGVLSFDPLAIKKNTYLPPIVLTALKQGGAPLATDRAPERVRTVVLDWRRNFFEFEYAALNYTQPEKCQYQYILEGYDSKWFHAGTKRFGRYTNLPGGTYTLKIKGSNNDGVWNEKGLQISVVVTSPFWKTGWFYLILAGGSIGVVAFTAFYLFKLKFEIGERKQAETQLQESENRYRSLLESQTELVFRFKPDGTLTFVNQVYCDFFGKSREELIGKKGQPLSVEDDRIIIAEHMKHVSLSDQTVVSENRVHSAGGEIHWMQFVNKGVFDSSGALLEIQSVGRDITDRKKIELALSQNEAYLKTLINTIPDLVWLKDQNGVYLFCNAKFQRFFGADEKEIIGKRDYDFVDGELADFFREHDKLAMAKGGPSVNEEEVTYADDGHRELLETIKTPMFENSGRLIGVLGIARDITERKHSEEERKKLEEQLRQSHKMEAIGTIAGGIAHDFNNILGIIIGNMELALDSIEDPDSVQMNLEEIKAASLRASEVVKQLLNFSRKTEQAKKTIDIGLLVKESIKLLRASIPTSIDIQTHVPERLKTIKADPTQVHQVLINLCMNAAHAMEKDGGVLKIDLSEVELDQITTTQFDRIPAGRYIQLAISDTGHGIDPGIKANIFDPYFTTKAVGKGTGMGLAVVLGIVKNHSGAISVYSEPGKGTTFTVLFPVNREPSIDQPANSEAPPKGHETILFIDDEAGLANIGSLMLRRLGYSVVTRTDPREALALFRAEPSRFDLIVTDMTMPHLTGDQLIKEALKISPGIPTVLCTGFSNKMDEKRAAEIGARGYIEKPLAKHRLAECVRKALDG